MAWARKFEDLICWQLADELKTRIYRILARPAVKKDFDYCRQTRKAVRSTPALIAEGFGRKRHTELARYLEMALGELSETRNHLRDGAQSEYLTVDEYRELWRLCYRAQRAATKLHADIKRRIAAARTHKTKPDVPLPDVPTPDVPTPDVPKT